MFTQQNYPHNLRQSFNVVSNGVQMLAGLNTLRIVLFTLQQHTLKRLKNDSKQNCKRGIKMRFAAHALLLLAFPCNATATHTHLHRKAHHV